jgi:hypothetical protein
MPFFNRGQKNMFEITKVWLVVEGLCYYDRPARAQAGYRLLLNPDWSPAGDNTVQAGHYAGRVRAVHFKTVARINAELFSICCKFIRLRTPARHRLLLVVVS